MTILYLPGVQERSVPPTTGGSSHHPSRRVVMFGSLALLYFLLGCLLVMRYNLFDPDAPSRVANAAFVLGSRDPHLSAIGFVWNPLPSLVEVPILQLSQWWPPLRTRGLAGVVQSALFMAGSAVVVDRIAEDREVGMLWRRVSVAAFALQPMILVYGASGMSEGAEVFCLLWCVRRLMLWTDSRRPADLAGAGLALGLGYLARYEVVPAAVAAAVFVLLVTACGSRRSPPAQALADMAIILFPIVVTATVWALGGWVVDQELFATLSSRYGNSAIVRTAIRDSAPTIPSGSGDWVGIAARLFGMQPFVGVAAAAAVAQWGLHRKVTALVPVVVLAPVLIFAGWGQSTSATFGYFRYYLLAIPLVICVALALWIPADGRPQPRASSPTQKRPPRVAVALVVSAILIGYPVSVIAALNERIGNQPLNYGFNSLLFPDRFTSQGPQQVAYRRLMVDDRLMADYVDRLHLSDGSVLMDTFTGWGIWLSSAHPKQFVITSDFDFKADLNRPWEQGVHYLVIGNPAINEADAVAVRYPSLWDDGAGMSELVYAVVGVNGEERFRLYRVTGPLVSPHLP